MKKLYYLLLLFSICSFSNSLFGQRENIPEPKKGHKRYSEQFKSITSKIDEIESLKNRFSNERSGTTDKAGSVATSNYDYLEFLDGGSNLPYASITDSTGNTFITGAASNADSPQGDFTTIMIDASGNLGWESKLEGQRLTGEMGKLLILDNAGNPIVAGVTWNGSDMDITVIKYNALTGSIIWESRFDSGNDVFEYPTAIQINASDEIFIAGMVPMDTSVEYLTLKMDANGKVLWNAIDNNPIAGTWSEPTAIAVDASGNVAVTGIAAVDGDSSGYYQGYLTLGYDANGIELWRKPFLFERPIDENNPESGMTPTHSLAQDIAFDSKGNTYVTGTFDNTSLPRMGLIKYSPAGEELWIETHNAELNGERATSGTDIEITDSDQIIVAGSQTGDFSSEGIFVVSYTDVGDLQWSNLTSDTAQPQGMQMSLDKNGLPIISHYGYDSNTSDQRVRIRRYSLEGEVVTEGSYLLPFSPTFNITGLTNVSLDADDNMFIVLNNFYSEKGNVMETVKKTFNTSPNDPLWNYIYETPNSKSNTRLLTTTVSGSDLYATGDHAYIKDGEYMQVYFVVKYNEDGTVAWRKEFDPGVGNGADGIVAVTNKKGELLVVLLAYAYSVNEFRIIKLSSTGETVWETKPSFINPSFTSFLVDQDDNLFLAGNAPESEGDTVNKFFVTKFSDSGKQEWSTSFDTENEEDTTFQLNAGRVTSSGNIVYTGASGVGSFFSQKLDLTVFSISNGGDVNWLQKFPQENYNTSGNDLALDTEDNIFVAGVRQDNLVGTEELNILKINSEGESDWTVNYGQVEVGRRMNPYKIALTGTGDPIITSYSLYSVPGEPTNNRVSAVQFEGESGGLNWVYNSPLDFYYADSYVDGDNTTYLYCQKSFLSMHRITQSLTGGALIKIGADGLQQDDEMDFVQEQEAVFFPKTLSPLDNGKLVLSGYINHENDFFSGLYFFEDSHRSLGLERPNDSIHGENLIKSIYPNPASHEINVSLQLTREARVGYKIIDLQGRTLLKSKEQLYTSGTNTLKIDLPQLSKGIYLCQLFSGTKSVSKKFIVK